MENFAGTEPFIALSPLDGRYRALTADLVDYFSEPALNRARIYVETQWLIFLCDNALIPGIEPLSDEAKRYLRNLAEDFDAKGIERLSILESVTRHDVKAVEYFIKEALANPSAPAQLAQLGEMVHLFATSEDANNLAYAVSIREGINTVWLPAARNLLESLRSAARDYADIPMLARTHGQAASPTTVGKEIAVFAHRFGRQVEQIEKTEFLGKFNGATGTYGAHSVALPDVDWPATSKAFVEKLGLTWNPLTTQIESHDGLAELFTRIAHANAVAHNLATDMWTYISLGYFTQNLSAQGSTGSSTMPHKVNPIRFENAESNFETSTALLTSLSQTLVTSRMQRDLTDSSTLRTIGVALGHSLVALKNIHAGLQGVSPNPDLLAEELDQHWEVLAEPIQQALRVALITGQTDVDRPYERLKELTRGHKVDADAIHAFIRSLDLPPQMAERLLALTPATYIGIAPKLVEYLGA